MTWILLDLLLFNIRISTLYALGNDVSNHFGKQQKSLLKANLELFGVKSVCTSSFHNSLTLGVITWHTGSGFVKSI